MRLCVRFRTFNINSILFILSLTLKPCVDLAQGFNLSIAGNLVAIIDSLYMSKLVSIFKLGKFGENLTVTEYDQVLTRLLAF